MKAAMMDKAATVNFPGTRVVSKNSETKTAPSATEHDYELHAGKRASIRLLDEICN